MCLAYDLDPRKFYALSKWPEDDEEDAEDIAETSRSGSATQEQSFDKAPQGSPFAFGSSDVTGAPLPLCRAMGEESVCRQATARCSPLGISPFAALEKPASEKWCPLEAETEPPSGEQNTSQHRGAVLLGSGEETAQRIARPALSELQLLGRPCTQNSEDPKIPKFHEVRKFHNSFDVPGLPVAPVAWCGKRGSLPAETSKRRSFRSSLIFLL